MKNTMIIFCELVLLLITGCCKHKTESVCNANQFQINALREKYGSFTCGGNLYEYQYIMRRQAEIDSLFDCHFAPPVPFPVDETNMIYIMVGRMAYHYRDTFQTTLFKDTCNKILVCQLDMVQQDTAFNTFPGVVSIFSEVENIPADYQVEVKYKYVPIQ